jgi:TolB protein
VIDADGTDLHKLTDNAVHDEGPSWSPDGRRVVFTSGPSNLEGGIWVMNDDGAGRMQITDSPGVATSLRTGSRFRTATNS